MKKMKLCASGAKATKGPEKDPRTKVTTKTTLVTPEKKGKHYIEEGTVQRNPSGKGVTYVPKKDQASIENKKGKILDPKSGSVEKDTQLELRKNALKVHENVDLSKRYKEGDYVTYDTKKGSQVAGKIKKHPDEPAVYKTEQVEEHKTTKNYGNKRTEVSQIAKRASKEGTSMSQSNQKFKEEGGGQYGTLTPKKSKYVESKDLGSSYKKGYTPEVSETAKKTHADSKKSETFKEKKMKLKTK